MQKKTQDDFNLFFQQPTQKNFSTFYQGSSPRLFTVILRILRDKAQAEECLQETYLKIWQKIDSYDEHKATAITWMSNIAKNTAIDMLRKNKLIYDGTNNLSSIESLEIPMIEQLTRDELTKALHDCLKQLNPATVQILLWSYFYSLTYEVIANKVNQPVSTIKSRVRRSLPTLKECLKLKVMD